MTPSAWSGSGRTATTRVSSSIRRGPTADHVPSPSAETCRAPTGDPHAPDGVGARGAVAVEVVGDVERAGDRRERVGEGREHASAPARQPLVSSAHGTTVPPAEGRREDAVAWHHPPVETIAVKAARRLALARAGLLKPEWTGLPTRAAGRGARARAAAHAVIGRFGYLLLRCYHRNAAWNAPMES